MNINPFDIIKNAQKIQEQMGSLKEKIKEINVTGSAGGGMVEIDIDGNMTMLAVRISPEVLDDADMLEDLIIAAFNSASEKLREELGAQMGALTGVNFPAGFPL